MFDSGSGAWEEGEFSLQQSHDAVSQRMAAQCTETHTVQPQYIIFYGTYATSMSPTRGASQASKPSVPRQKTCVYIVLQMIKNALFLLLLLSLLP